MKQSMKKIISLFLVLLLIITSVFVLSTSVFAQESNVGAPNTAALDEATPDEASKDEAAFDEPTVDEIETYRYYYYLPEEWENEYSDTAGIYWWEGTNACTYDWPGYKAKSTDVEGLYYYDVPKDVTSIMWNNFIDGGVDPSSDMYKAAKQTKNIGTEYYEPKESEYYPEGLPNFDNMVYVVDFAKINMNEYGGKTTYCGEWFYYYGSGEYGFTPDKGEEFFTGRSYNSDEWEDTKPTEPKPTIPSLEPYYTVYFVNTEDWEDVYLYYWISEREQDSAVWPGEPMKYERTDTQGNDIYSCEISHLTDLIIFANGEDQTGDITANIEDGNAFCLYEKKEGTWWSYDVWQYSDVDFDMGDTDCDGKVNIKDATAIQKHLASLESLNRVAMGLADFDGDEALNIKDATAIQKFIAGISE